MAANPNDPRILDHIRHMSGAKRVQLGVHLSAMARRLVESGVRSAHPDWNNERIHGEVERRFAHSRMIYGAKTSPV